MVAFLRRLARRWRGEKGAEFVEFALAFPLLVLVMMGILDFGLMFQQYEVITNAAREGARLASMPGYTSAQVQARVTNYTDAALLTTGGTVRVFGPATTLVPVAGACISEVTVVVQYPHEFMFIGGLMSWTGSKALTAASSMRTEISAGGGC